MPPSWLLCSTPVWNADTWSDTFSPILAHTVMRIWAVDLMLSLTHLLKFCHYPHCLLRSPATLTVFWQRRANDLPVCFPRPIQVRVNVVQLANVQNAWISTTKMVLGHGNTQKNRDQSPYCYFRWQGITTSFGVKR
jgi:hypothetical protein